MKKKYKSMLSDTLSALDEPWRVKKINKRLSFPKIRFPKIKFPKFD